MFRAVLEHVVESTEGAWASVLMDLDGIAVDSYSAVEAAVPDVRHVGVELSVVLRSVKHAVEMLEVGRTEEVVLVAAELTTLVRMVSDAYFVAVVLGPGGNLGRARYLLRTHVPELVSELS